MSAGSCSTRDVHEARGPALRADPRFRPPRRAPRPTAPTRWSGRWPTFSAWDKRAGGMYEFWTGGGRQSADQKASVAFARSGPASIPAITTKAINCWTLRQMTRMFSSGDARWLPPPFKQDKPNSVGVEPQTLQTSATGRACLQSRSKRPRAHPGLGLVQRGGLRSSRGFPKHARPHEARVAADLEPGPVDAGLGAGRRLQGASSSVRRRDGGRVGAAAQSRTTVRARNPYPGDDRRRHSKDARDRPQHRRRPRRPVIF